MKFVWTGRQVMNLLSKGTAESDLLLVHDEGVYLIPSEIPDGAIPVNVGAVEYAKNHGPSTHMGGDDFVETIPRASVMKIQPTDQLVVVLTSTQMTVTIFRNISWWWFSRQRK